MESFQTSDKLYSHSMRKKQIRNSALKNDTTSVRKKFFSLGFNKKVSGGVSEAKERISPPSGQDNLNIGEKNSFEFPDLNTMNQSD